MRTDSIEQLRQRLRECGAKPCHEQRVLRAWLHARPLDSGARRHRPEDYLPLGIRNVLPELKAHYFTKSIKFIGIYSSNQ
jgi:23S rRNA (adenine2503-C2)-methyltransferase